MLVFGQGSESAHGAANCADLMSVDAGSPDFGDDAVGAGLHRAVYLADEASGRVPPTIASAFLGLEVP